MMVSTKTTIIEWDMNKLEDALRRPVDLGEVDSFRPHVRAAFERERVAIF